MSRDRNELILQLRELSDKQPPVVLCAGADAILGRDASVSYVVSDPTVSRRHAMLTVRDGLLLVTDLSSANGSYVNGAEVREVTRAASLGDSVQFGSVVFRLEQQVGPVRAAAPAAPPQPAAVPVPPTQQPAVPPPVPARHRNATVLAAGPPQRDLMLARKIQMALTGGQSMASGPYTISHWYRPARELSGDLLLYCRRETGDLWAVLGDVCDKGLPSALLMAFITGAARGLIQHVSSPSALLDELGEMVRELGLAGMFATAVALVIDARRHRCEIALAGHAPAMLRKADGSVVELSGPPGTALGAASAEQTVAQRISLGIGDTIVLYSDGIDECQNEAGETFGLDRWRELIARNSPEQLVKQTETSLLAYRGSREWHDDLTLMCLTRSH